MTLQVIEIFASIEGEGNHVGTPTVFVRLAGCSIGCAWCDTKESWNSSNGTSYSGELLFQKTKSLAQKYGIERVSITGGNPMESTYSDLIDFILLCRDNRYSVNIEHPGIFLDKAKEIKILNTLCIADTVTIDIKPPSSKVQMKVDDFIEVLGHIKGPLIFIKAVFETKEDLIFIDDFLSQVNRFRYATFSIQPCIDTEFNSQVIVDNKDFILKVLTSHKGNLIPQIHKFIGME